MVFINTNDALGNDDLTGLVGRMRRGETCSGELVQAAIDRATASRETLRGLTTECFDQALAAAQKPIEGPFAGIPVVIKDNVEVAGLPTRYGSAAVPPCPARRDDAVAALLRQLGLICIGKSSMSEFGFNASDESTHRPPVCNPWNLLHSCGASSSGSAALVAAGVIPLGHGNDGGGSIRIPASACGLVGLKTSRGRMPDSPSTRWLPVPIVTQGVLTRSVRDTRLFHEVVERYHRPARLASIADGDGNGNDRVRHLRIGVLRHSVQRAVTESQTVETVDRVAKRLSELGYQVRDVEAPVSGQFAQDFAMYWMFLGWLVVRSGRSLFGREFERSSLENLTAGLAEEFRRQWHRLPGVIHRLRLAHQRLSAGLREHDVDVILSPVTTHPAPPLGHLDAGLRFDELFERLSLYVGFTPLANAAGTPAIAIPAGRTAEGVPIGVQLAANRGQDAMLLDIAEQLWPAGDSSSTQWFGSSGPLRGCVGCD